MRKRNYYTWATSESVYSEPRDSKESSERQAHAEACCLVHVGIFRHLDKHECKWTYNTLGKIYNMNVSRYFKMLEDVWKIPKVHDATDNMEL